MSSSLFILFLILIAAFYKIQILEHEKWSKIAHAQHQYVVTLPFKRGSFYSNTTVKKGHPEDQQPFVIDIPKFHLYIDPDSIPKHLKAKMAEELYNLLQFDFAMRKKTWPEFEKKSRSRKIVKWLDRSQRKRIEAWWKQFAKTQKIAGNALFFTKEFKRSYPFGSMLGAVLHTLQEEKDPKTGQGIPTGGLELVYNSYLQGKPGKTEIIRSPLHPIDSGKILEPSVNGADIYLTVNHYLQAIVETELKKGVKTANAKGGWAVMMDPNTGEILAIAQTPSFNPSRYREYFNHPELQDAARVRAIADCYEPGSIFKPITLAVCLKANEELANLRMRPIFSADEWIETANGWFPGRSNPLKDGRVHRYLNMDLAIQKSSNIYMGKLIHRLIQTMGDAWYRKTLQEVFGFGMKTHVELPAESPGLLPTPGKLHPNGKLEWSVPTPYSLAIGHNILINALQITKAYAILANGGKAVEPHLVRKIVKTNSDGTKTILLDKTSLTSKQVLSPSICKRIVHSMKFATKEGGTSKRADVSGYTEAGKSGTAEKVIDGTYAKDHNISSFLGFAPAENPRFVLLISLDDPEKKFIPGVGKHQMGGVSAAPIFREIASQALMYLGVQPDDPYGYAIGDPRRDTAKADFTKEVAELRALYEKWN